MAKHEIKKETIEFTEKIADFIIANDCTFTEASIRFNTSPGTVRHYCNSVLPRINEKKYLNVRNIIDSHRKNPVRVAPKPDSEYYRPANTVKQNDDTQKEPSTETSTKRKHKRIKNYDEVFDYVLEHKMSVADASEHFGISDGTFRTNLNKLKDTDFEKYTAIKEMHRQLKSKKGVLAYYGSEENIPKDSIYYKNTDEKPTTPEPQTVPQEDEKDLNVFDKAFNYIISTKCSVSDACAKFEIDSRELYANLRKMKNTDKEKYKLIRNITADAESKPLEVIENQVEPKTDIETNVHVEDKKVDIEQDTEVAEPADVPAIEAFEEPIVAEPIEPVVEVQMPQDSQSVIFISPAPKKISLLDKLKMCAKILLA